MRNLAITLGMLTPFLISSKVGSSSRSFLESDRFRERYFEMNQRNFQDDVDLIVHILMVDLWNGKIPQAMVLGFTIHDLAGNRKGQIVLNPEVKNSTTSPLPVLAASANPNTKEIKGRDGQTAYYLLYLNIYLSYGDQLNAIKFSKRIQSDPAYRLKVKTYLKQIISHELYHLVDPRKMKTTAGKAIDQLVTERPTYTMNFVDNFWRKAYCMDDMLELVMNNPRKFWEEYADEIAEIIAVDDKSIGLPIPNWGSSLTTNIINAIQESIREKSDVSKP